MGILKNSGLDAPLLLNTTIVRREACHYCRLPELITASSSGRFILPSGCVIRTACS
jgi:hypothetical protein